MCCTLFFYCNKLYSRAGGVGCPLDPINFLLSSAEPSFIACAYFNVFGALSFK